MASAASIALQLQRLSNEATDKSFQYNTKEANTARSWQKEMSDTSHQREVQDLVKAGLNPVLSSGGSGAQSYTTSSASAQAENAAGPVANVWSSDISAKATRAAAAASAAATRYAASQQAAAARYSAALNYEASIFHSKQALKASNYRTDKDYDIKKYGIDNQLASNPIQAIDKVTRNLGIQDAVKNGSILKNAVKSVGLISGGKFSTLAQNMSYNIKNGYPALKYDGKKVINSIIGKLGIDNTSYNRNLVLRAVLVQKPTDILQLYKIMNNARKAYQNSSNSSRRITIR